MKTRVNNWSFANLAQLIVALAMITLIVVAVIAFMKCLERDDIEDAIAVGGGIVMMVPITIILITTKF